MNKIKILHIIRDEKFFDLVIKNFEADDRLENQSILIVKTVPYQFKYIKQKEKVQLVEMSRIKSFLKTADYDVVYFHSLPPSFWHIVLNIPKEKIITWWSWGYEIYSNKWGLKPLLPIELYKPLTKCLYNGERNLCNVNYLKQKLRAVFYLNWIKRRILNRINYLQTVIPLEYRLLQDSTGIEAKEFYTYSKIDVDAPISPKHDDGTIQIGNSASFTNNHLDVWKKITEAGISGKKFVVPLSYGKGDVSVIRKSIVSKENDITILDTLLPLEDYRKIQDTCSYMVSGVLRQESMGNIAYCINKGIKLFLFKDSIVYKHLQSWNILVFAIEDINSSSFDKALTVDEIKHNRVMYAKYQEYRKEKYESVLSEIANTFNK